MRVLTPVFTQIFFPNPADEALKAQVAQLSCLVNETDWSAVLPAVRELIVHPAVDKNGIFYPTVCYLEIAALYRLGNYDEVVSRIPEIISKQTIKVSGKPGGLTSRQAATYEGMLHYFLMDSYIHQSGQNPAWQEKVLQVLDSFIAG